MKLEAAFKGILKISKKSKDFFKRTRKVMKNVKWKNIEMKYIAFSRP